MPANDHNLVRVATLNADNIFGGGAPDRKDLLLCIVPHGVAQVSEVVSSLGVAGSAGGACLDSSRPAVQLERSGAGQLVQDFAVQTLIHVVGKVQLDGIRTLCPRSAGCTGGGSSSGSDSRDDGEGDLFGVVIW